MILACVLVVMAAQPFADAVPAEPPELRDLLPGVRVAEGVVEFRGTVCADLSHEQTPVVYLELLVTGPDSREHESLVVTRVKPSAIHAGLLAAGMEPGNPVRWGPDGIEKPAAGPRVRVEAAVVGEGGMGPFVELASWVVRKETGDRLVGDKGWGLVFAGSVTDDRGYAADKAGTIVGLTGFGTEVVAAAWGLSPTASVDEPVWIVDKATVPTFGTEVVVRIARIKSAEEAPEGEPGT
jgi:hypothetical protein